MKKVLAAGVLVGLLALTGCAADPDLADLEGRLGAVTGAQGATVYTTHSGAPWNTQVVVLLFVSDPSAEAVEASVRDAARVLVADDVASRDSVTISAIEGAKTDFAARSDATAAKIPVMKTVGTAIGVESRAGVSLVFTPDDLAAVAAR